MLYAEMVEGRIARLVSTEDLSMDDLDLDGLDPADREAAIEAMETKIAAVEALKVKLLADGFADITGKEVTIGDQTDDGGATFREREPGISVLARCFVKVLKDNQEVLIIDDQVKAILQKFKD